VIGFYRVFLSLLVLFTAIAARAEMGARELALEGCNIECREGMAIQMANAAAERAQAAQAATLASLGAGQGSSQGAGVTGGATATVSVSGTLPGPGSAAPVNQCPAGLENLSPQAYAAIQASNPQLIAGCGGPGSAPAGGQLFTDPGQCVSACMTRFMASVGVKPEDQRNQGGLGSNIGVMLQLLQDTNGGDQNGGGNGPGYGVYGGGDDSYGGQGGGEAGETNFGPF
jgi:hypothetical protein